MKPRLLECVPAEVIVNAEPVVRASEAICIVFAVVCSESISKEGRPAARLESTNIPLPPSDCTVNPVAATAKALLLMIVAKLLVSVAAESEST